MWLKLVWFSLAGAMGTLLRFGLDSFVHRFLSREFPWGTLAVNSVGCLLFGVVWTLAQERYAISHATQAILLTGFMGAFTTFSTFAFDTGSMVRDSQWLPALGNLLAHNLLGVLCILLGFVLGRILWIPS